MLKTLLSDIDTYFSLVNVSIIECIIVYTYTAGFRNFAGDNAQPGKCVVSYGRSYSGSHAKGDYRPLEEDATAQASSLKLADFFITFFLQV